MNMLKPQALFVHNNPDFILSWASLQTLSFHRMYNYVSTAIVKMCFHPKVYKYM